MYQTIYELLGSCGIVQSAVITKGEYKGTRAAFAGKDRSVPKDMPWEIWDKYSACLKQTSQTAYLEEEGLFVEWMVRNPHLVILGGGHVSQPVAQIGKMLGFHVTVMDDREEFVTRERFPWADALLLGDFAQLAQKVPAYENSYYVIVTRGHAGDSLCLEQILQRPAAYVGMIGSRTKVKLTRERLMDKGFAQEELDRVHAPIGLPLGGQTPEEIAVSILSEIVKEKNRNYMAYQDEDVENAILSGKKGIMMTIIKKHGSSPRGVGSKMFVDLQGKTYGSIGGGSVEYETLCHSAQVRDVEIQEYDLSLADSKNLGMICGGKVEVLFEIVK